MLQARITTSTRLPSEQLAVRWGALDLRQRSIQVIRQRRAYNTRHTYATLTLMAGVNVAYIAQQLDHASVVTTLTYYARWVRGGDGGAEAKKLNAALNPSNGSQIGPETKLEDL